jgi:hypothetical protein
MRILSDYRIFGLVAGIVFSLRFVLFQGATIRDYESRSPADEEVNSFDNQKKVSCLVTLYSI